MSQSDDASTDQSTDPGTTEGKDSDRGGSSDSGLGISDDQLPDDLVPGEDNPLAEGLPPGEAPDPDLTKSTADEDTDDTDAEDGEDAGDD